MGSRKEEEMELPLHMLPLCCLPLNTGYFHHVLVLSRLSKLSKPKLGKSARDILPCVFKLGVAVTGLAWAGWCSK
jgi:hypothetical protein